MMFRGKRLGLTMWGTEPVAAMVRHAALAERIGFDNVWLIDSQLLCRDDGDAGGDVRRAGHHASADADHAAGVPDSLVDRYALAGTVESVRDGLARLLDRPGVSRVILNPRIVGPGAKPLDVVLRELETQVLPYL